AVSLAACVPAPARPTPTETITSSPVSTETQPATLTPAATLTPTPRTPPTLPVPYQNDSLTPFGSPHTYIQKPCQYLQDKWSSANSAAGTVVMVIMFHSITDGNPSDPNQMSEFKLRTLMNKLHDEGFTAINITQMADFMEHNAKIPERSVLLVVDDRHYARYFDVFFRQYWTDYGWPVVNAWISLDDSVGQLSLPDNVALENEGWVDHQAHGFIHNIPIGPDSTEEYILGELQKPIDVFRENFHKMPIAVIWPGGGFTPHAAEVARQLGYRLGFTTNPRGPVMFNWVPLSDINDPQRTTWIPEGPVNDPLMVLPRYWDTDAIIHIKEVMQVGQEAAAYAEQNKATELEYYDIVCAPQYGPSP
ncbi:MAG: polysaccharide deacetylase family protein, partial [Candidatus Bipolaricaulota bacterium]|nr:polysaccharide deacetylase family protein [Candidatus Bipolaricaulota bacterium]